MSDLTIIERGDGLRYGLVSIPRYHEACKLAPSFTPREIAVLERQTRRIARIAKPARAPALPLPAEVVRALIEIKAVFPEATIEDFDEPCVSTWGKVAINV